MMMQAEDQTQKQQRGAIAGELESRHCGFQWDVALKNGVKKKNRGFSFSGDILSNIVFFKFSRFLVNF